MTVLLAIESVFKPGIVAISYRKQCWSVTRRFSDYLGLHSKLVEKHLHSGRIIPPAPEKDALNTTKIRVRQGVGRALVG